VPRPAAPGAFGRADVRRIRTDGARSNLLTLQATLAGPFCAQRSDSPLLDSAAVARVRKPRV